MRFTRTLQKRVTATGTHYILSIPMEIAQDLDLQGGGLCSIEIRNKCNKNKKAEAVLMAYKDTPPLYREIFDPTRVHSGDGTHGFIEVPIPPRTRGPSGSWGHGRVLDRALLRELRAARLFVEAEVKRLWPRRRRKRKMKYY